jgi:hypothetical protein
MIENPSIFSKNSPQSRRFYGVPETFTALSADLPHQEEPGPSIELYQLRAP